MRNDYDWSILNRRMWNYLIECFGLFSDIDSYNYSILSFSILQMPPRKQKKTLNEMRFQIKFDIKYKFMCRRTVNCLPPNWRDILERVYYNERNVAARTPLLMGAFRRTASRTWASFVGLLLSIRPIRCDLPPVVYVCLPACLTHGCLLLLSLRVKRYVSRRDRTIKIMIRV